jgi:hypothetical protein
MIRTLFKYKTTEQKEFENLHGTNARILNQTNKLQNKVETFVGEGEPSKAIGKSGDVYIDKSTSPKTIYNKVNGIWNA